MKNEIGKGRGGVSGDFYLSEFQGFTQSGRLLFKIDFRSFQALG
jgi:hypothetical protein